MNLAISGKVERGKFRPDSARLFKGAFEQFEGKACEVVVRPIKRGRSIQQNRYYWRVVLKAVADYSGSTVDEVHYYCKESFSPLKNCMGKDCRLSTTDLSTVEMEEYLSRVREWALHAYGISIPKPNEAE